MIQKAGYYLDQLESGASVLIHPIPGSKSTTIAVAYGAGSRYETPQNNGISHFLEHMFFKGTDSLTYDDVNKTFAKLGAVTNAFTYYNVTYYYAKGPSSNLNELISLWADLLQNAALREEDFLKEKQVVIEELKASRDNPTHYINTKTIELLFEGTSWGLPLGGNIETVRVMTLDMLKNYRRRHYSLSNALILVIGGCKAQNVIKILESCFQNADEESTRPEFEKMEIKWKKTSESDRNTIKVRNFVEPRSLPATYVNLAMRAPGTLEDWYYVLELLNVGLGEARTSKLYHDIVRKGIALRANSSIVAQPDVSAWIITARLGKDNLTRYFQEIWKALRDFRDQRVTQSLKDKWFRQLKGQFMVDMEQPTELAFWLALRYWETGEVVTLNDHLNHLSQVTPTMLNELKETLLSNPQMQSVLLGDVEEGFEIPLPEEW